jgi:hypothetical protein
MLSLFNGIGGSFFALKEAYVAAGRPLSLIFMPVELDKSCRTSEKDAKLAQKLGQLQPFLAVFPQKCTGQLAPSFGPT